MTLRQFDIAAWIMLASVFGFAVGVASGWDWFPDFALSTYRVMYIIPLAAALLIRIYMPTLPE
jgi:hypothetical protein